MTSLGDLAVDRARCGNYALRDALIMLDLAASIERRRTRPHAFLCGVIDRAGRLRWVAYETAGAVHFESIAGDTVAPETVRGYECTLLDAEHIVEEGRLALRRGEGFAATTFPTFAEAVPA